MGTTYQCGHCGDTVEARGWNGHKNRADHPDSVDYSVVEDADTEGGTDTVGDRPGGEIDDDTDDDLNDLDPGDPGGDDLDPDDLDPADEDPDADDLDLEDDEGEAYHCGNCGAQVEYLQKRCDECGEKMLWSRIDA